MMNVLKIISACDLDVDRYYQLNEKERFDIYIHRQVCYIGWQEI